MQHIIALIFDFDITLSPKFQQYTIFEEWGIELEELWKNANEYMDKGYDMEHSYIRAMMDYGKRDEKYILNNQLLYEYGKKVALYQGLSREDGLHSIFDDMREYLQQTKFRDYNIDIECYCISGGLKEMIKGAFDRHNLNDYFKEIFACEIDEEEGRLTFPKETVGHTIKTQKIHMIAKGISPDRGDHPHMVNDVIPNLRVPFENMIFLGDGQTDIPSFAMLNRLGGKTIAVYREEEDELKTLQAYQKGYELAFNARRAEQLLPADYSSSKPLKLAMLGYLDTIATNIVESYR